MHGVFFELAFDIHHVIGAGDLVAVHCTPTGRTPTPSWTRADRFAAGH